MLMRELDYLLGCSITNIMYLLHLYCRHTHLPIRYTGNYFYEIILYSADRNCLHERENFS